jgi:hypothetical protein
MSQMYNLKILTNSLLTEQKKHYNRILLSKGLFLLESEHNYNILQQKSNILKGFSYVSLIKNLQHKKTDYIKIFLNTPNYIQNKIFLSQMLCHSDINVKVLKYFKKEVLLFSNTGVSTSISKKQLIKYFRLLFYFFHKNKLHFEKTCHILKSNQIQKLLKISFLADLIDIQYKRYKRFNKKIKKSIFIKGYKYLKKRDMSKLNLKYELFLPKNNKISNICKVKESRKNFKSK